MGLFSGATYGLQTTSGPATPRAKIVPKPIGGPTTTHILSTGDGTVQPPLESYSRHFRAESKRENRRNLAVLSGRWADREIATRGQSRKDERAKARKTGPNHGNLKGQETRKAPCRPGERPDARSSPPPFFFVVSSFRVFVISPPVPRYGLTLRRAAQSDSPASREPLFHRPSSATQSAPRLEPAEIGGRSGVWKADRKERPPFLRRPSRSPGPPGP